MEESGNWFKGKVKELQIFCGVRNVEMNMPIDTKLAVAQDSDVLVVPPQKESFSCL